MRLPGGRCSGDTRMSPRAHAFSPGDMVRCPACRKAWEVVGPETSVVVRRRWVAVTPGLHTVRQCAGCKGEWTVSHEAHRQTA